MKRILLATMLTCLTLPTPARQAHAASTYAYSWADQPITPSYSPYFYYTYNPTGGATTINRIGVGLYDVTWSGFSSVTSANGGNLQASAYYTGSAYCEVEYWGADFVQIACYDIAGNPVDSYFTTLYTKPLPGETGLAYAWAFDPTTASYDASGYYAYNPSGGGTHIDHISTGVYDVSWPGFGPSFGGNVQVTAYGPSNNSKCKVVYWGSENTQIACYDVAGNPVDSRFSVLYLKPDSPRPDVAYAWGNDPVSASYNPSSFYSYNPTGGATTITKVSTGVWDVKWDGLGGVGFDGGHLKVSAYGSGNEACKIVYWGSDYVEVACYDNAGNPVDTRYSVAYFKPAGILASADPGPSENLGTLRNFPNPARDRVTIAYALATAGPVDIGVFDIAGRRMQTVVDGWKTAGAHEATFSARGFKPGVYMYRMRTATDTQTRRLVISE